MRLNSPAYAHVFDERAERVFLSRRLLGAVEDIGFVQRKGLRSSSMADSAQ